MVSSVRVMNYTAWQAWEELSMDHLGAPYLCGTRRAYTFVCDSRVDDQKAEIRMHGAEGGISNAAARDVFGGETGSSQGSLWAGVSYASARIRAGTDSDMVMFTDCAHHMEPEGVLAGSSDPGRMSITL